MYFLLIALLLCGADEQEKTAAPAKEERDSPARRIFLEIHRAILENAKRPQKPSGARIEGRKFPAGEKRADRFQLQGDDLSDHLIRTGLRAARGEIQGGTEPRAAIRGLLHALGASFDRARLFDHHPLIKLVAKSIETTEERRARIEALQGPTLRGRADALQHFAVSAALAALLGEPAALSAGIEKECLDAAGKDRGQGSGFSFADLAAGLAGIAWASGILEKTQSREQSLELLDQLSARFHGKDCVPDLRKYDDDPLEHLGWKEFTARFGSIQDPRFQSRMITLRKEVLSSPSLAEFPPDR